jgi:hypothetical protein
MKPQILASKIVTRVDPVHAFLINRNKLGSMILPGESLFVLEMQRRATPSSPPTRRRSMPISRSSTTA